MSAFRIATFTFIFLTPTTGLTLTPDEMLDRVLSVYGLSSEFCRAPKQLTDIRLVDAGREIFRSKDLSGSRDSACSICHLEENNLIDGLPVAIGVGGKGEGLDRLANAEGVIVPRNAFTLFGRGLASYRSYFWDGRVEHGDDGNVISQFGDSLDSKFSSLLSIAAVQPLLARDEFLGIMEAFDQATHLDAINDKHYQERYDAASAFYRVLINTAATEELRKIRELLVLGGIEPSRLVLADIGNAIASFLTEEFSCPDTRWNEYKRGDKEALTESEKAGALLFYGKARCAACHSGDLLSDFKPHSISAPQGAFGVAALGQDFGRSDITLAYEDRYLFRTPPLILVSKTAPYGHSGQFESLEEALLHHFNPVLYFQKHGWANDFEMLNFGKILGSRDQTLTFIDILNVEEFTQLLDFLETL